MKRNVYGDLKTTDPIYFRLKESNDICIKLDWLCSKVWTAVVLKISFMHNFAQVTKQWYMFQLKSAQCHNHSTTFTKHDTVGVTSMRNLI